MFAVGNQICSLRLLSRGSSDKFCSKQHYDVFKICSVLTSIFLSGDHRDITAEIEKTSYFVDCKKFMEANSLVVYWEEMNVYSGIEATVLRHTGCRVTLHRCLQSIQRLAQYKLYWRFNIVYVFCTVFCCLWYKQIRFWAKWNWNSIFILDWKLQVWRIRKRIQKVVHFWLCCFGFR